MTNRLEDNGGAALSRPGTASVRAEAGRFRFQAQVEVTPLHLLAIGGLVASILLAVPPIIQAARRTRAGRDETASGEPAIVPKSGRSS